MSARTRLNVGAWLAAQEAKRAELDRALREVCGWVEDERGVLVPPAMACGSAPRLSEVPSC